MQLRRGPRTRFPGLRLGLLDTRRKLRNSFRLMLQHRKPPFWGRPLENLVAHEGTQKLASFAVQQATKAVVTKVAMKDDDKIPAISAPTIIGQETVAVEVVSTSYVCRLCACSFTSVCLTYHTFLFAVIIEIYPSQRQGISMTIRRRHTRTTRSRPRSLHRRLMSDTLRSNNFQHRSGRRSAVS